MGIAPIAIKFTIQMLEEERAISHKKLPTQIITSCDNCCGAQESESYHRKTRFGREMGRK